jgi:hypothetical protein
VPLLPDAKAASDYPGNFTSINAALLFLIKAKHVRNCLAVAVFRAPPLLDVPIGRRNTGVPKLIPNLGQLRAGILHRVGKGVPETMNLGYAQAGIANQAEGPGAHGLAVRTVVRQGHPDRDVVRQVAELRAVERMQPVQQGLPHAGRQGVAHVFTAFGARKVDRDLLATDMQRAPAHAIDFRAPATRIEQHADERIIALTGSKSHL